MNKTINLLKVGNYILDFKKRTYIMGILNVTPDSFSDGGLFMDCSEAAVHAFQMIEDGADIIDVGGESTRPGARTVSLDEELKRVIPVIDKIRSQSDHPISVDTRKSEVAKQALQAGANMVNDISGLRYDRDMADTVSDFDVPVIIMHSNDDPSVMQIHIEYWNVIKDIQESLLLSVAIAKKSSIKDENIILDPGIGFGKTIDHNFQIIHSLSHFSTLGYPIMMGVSRKSFIGETLNLPERQRLWGTAAAVTASVLNGGHLMRVHDVKEMKQVVTIADRIKRAQSNFIDS